MKDATNRRSFLGLATLLLIAASLPAASPVNPVNKSGNGIALHGYDPVAYFQKSQPVKGTQQFSYVWNGATWLFSSQENRNEFTANPTKYAPQFGGYCSWAVGHGYTADVDPEAWRVHDGKLYLNYSKGVQKKWEKEMQPLIEQGNRNWPALHQ